MAPTIQIINRVLPIVLLLALGYVIRTRRFSSHLTIDELRKFVINVTLPAVLFISFLEIELKSAYLIIFGLIFGLCMLLFLLGQLLKKQLKIGSQFAYPGDGPLSGNPTHGFARPAIWDTWSTHYEFDGIDNNGNGLIDEFTNGVDDNNNGLVDEPNIYGQSGTPTGEQEAPPPYRSPLRGIKITLRVMEQDSKEVREVTIVHEFVPL